MEILFGFCTGGSLNKAIKAQTLKGCSCERSHTQILRSAGVRSRVRTGKVVPCARVAEKTQTALADREEPTNGISRPLTWIS